MNRNRIFVNSANYTNYKYDAFIDQSGNGIARPTHKEIPYEVGEVVYIISENSIGVVLGAINVDCEELRTDIDGMRGFSDVRPAIIEDFKIKTVRFSSKLYDEVKNVELRKVDYFRELSMLINNICTELENTLFHLDLHIAKDERKCPKCGAIGKRDFREISPTEVICEICTKSGSPEIFSLAVDFLDFAVAEENGIIVITPKATTYIKSGRNQFDAVSIRSLVNDAVISVPDIISLLNDVRALDEKYKNI